mmetsp:Transcript_42120/g.110880  ORF Transcript_42120/g.110880 Transcript_42120/m.110880 type:complete len:161 (-) Transcript_42120:811-1293(-)
MSTCLSNEPHVSHFARCACTLGHAPLCVSRILAGEAASALPPASTCTRAHTRAALVQAYAISRTLLTVAAKSPPHLHSHALNQCGKGVQVAFLLREAERRGSLARRVGVALSQRSSAAPLPRCRRRVGPSSSHRGAPHSGASSCVVSSHSSSSSLTSRAA